jgi:hypothetical protein
MRNRAEYEAEHLEYKHWLETIPGGRLIVTRRSGHNIPIEEPNLVVATIRQMVEQTVMSDNSVQLLGPAGYAAQR